MFGVRLPENLQNRLDTLAHKTHRSKSFYVREALSKYLEDLEDYYIADIACKEHIDSGEKTKTLEELAKELEIDLENK